MEGERDATAILNEENDEDRLERSSADVACMALKCRTRFRSGETTNSMKVVN